MKTHSVLLILFLVLCTSGSLLGQDPDPQRPFENPLQRFDLGPPQDPEADFRAYFTVDKSGKTGELHFVIAVGENCHTFSSTQGANGPGQPTKFSIQSGFTDAKMTGKIEADHDPEIHHVDNFDDPGEEHRGTVTWSAPIAFAAGVNASSLTIPVSYFCQVCTDGIDGEGGTCRPMDGKLKAKFRLPEDQFEWEHSTEEMHATVRASVNKTKVQPGDTVQLNLELEPESGWHVGELVRTPSTDSTPTLFALTKRNDATVGEFKPSNDPEKLGEGENAIGIHRGKVAWQIPIEIPRNAEEGEQKYAGLVGFQALRDGTDSLPQALRFEFKLDVGSQTIDGHNKVVWTAPDTIDYGTVGDEAQKYYEATHKNAGQFAGMSIPAVMGLAFLAGLILNIMPCVLPVIGLKVLSFVQQAGENPRRVLFLNLTFAAGIISVFLLLAGFAAFMGLGWGGLFQSQAFTIVMVSVVFAFGLSFLGVWEIPIPGFVSTSGSGKAAQTEGYSGAFIKGILTTLLATPCSGPLLIPAVTWAIAQTPAVTFLTFFFLGLGMAFPFIVIGFKPSLVSWLPKPGQWMETFKQLMGFVMIGTAVFFFNPITEKFQMPVLAFLVFLAMGCWLAGRISMLMEFPQRMKNWATALSVVALGAFIAFYVMVPQHELDWQPYSQIALDETMAEGNVVFIDFTADW